MQIPRLRSGLRNCTASLNRAGAEGKCVHPSTRRVSRSRIEPATPGPQDQPGWKTSRCTDDVQFLFFSPKWRPWRVLLRLTQNTQSRRSRARRVSIPRRNPFARFERNKLKSLRAPRGAKMQDKGRRVDTCPCGGLSYARESRQPGAYGKLSFAWASVPLSIKLAAWKIARPLRSNNSFRDA